MIKAQLAFTSLAALLLFSGCQSDPFASKFDSSFGSPYERKTPLQAIAAFPKTVGQKLRGDSSTTTETNWPRNERSLADRKPPLGANPKSPAAVGEFVEQGNKAFDNGDLDKASASYDVALRIDPNHAEAHHRRAVVADLQRDYQTAERHYLQAIRQRPNDPDLLSDLGYSYLLQQRYAESDRYLRQALQVNPTHRLAQNHLGELMRNSGNLQQARQHFQQAGNQQALAQLNANLKNNAYSTNPQPTSNNQFSAPYGNQMAGYQSQNALAGHNNAFAPTNNQPPYQQLQAQQSPQQSNPQLAFGGNANTPRAWPNGAFTAENRRQYPTHQFPGAGQQPSYPNQMSAQHQSPVQLSSNLTDLQHRNVPDHNLNDVLKSIDGGGQRSTSPHEFSAPSPTQNDPRAVVVSGNSNGSPRAPTHGTPGGHLVPLSQLSPAGRQAATPQQNLQAATGQNSLDQPAQNDPHNFQQIPVSTQHNSDRFTSPGNNPQLNRQGVQPAGFSSKTPSGQAPIIAGQPQPPTSNSAKAAAYLGMNAGFGQPFPVTPGNGPTQSVPMRMHPATNSRINGLQFPDPPRQFGSDRALSTPASFGGNSTGNQQTPNGIEMWPGNNNSSGNTNNSRQPQQLNAVDSQRAFLPANSPAPNRVTDPLAEYEDQIQKQNAEIDKLRQQLDSSRAHLMRQP